MKYTDELKHYGVKGMEWGKQKKEEEYSPEQAKTAAVSNNYREAYNSYQRMKAQFVSGKAKKSDVEAAKENARQAALEVKRRFIEIRKQNAAKFTSGEAGNEKTPGQSGAKFTSGQSGTALNRNRNKIQNDDINVAGAAGEEDGVEVNIAGKKRAYDDVDVNVVGKAEEDDGVKVNVAGSSSTSTLTRSQIQRLLQSARAKVRGSSVRSVADRLKQSITVASRNSALKGNEKVKGTSGNSNKNRTVKWDSITSSGSNKNRTVKWDSITSSGSGRKNRTVKWDSITSSGNVAMNRNQILKDAIRRVKYRKQIR